MKHTAFTRFHIDLGAKMIPFAGFLMPVEYSGITEEHILVRQKLGVFDVSHMGEFRISGPRALPFLQRITSNDVSVLVDGRVQYTCMPNGKGGIVDDLLIYRFGGEDYLMVVNAANTEKDWKWCCEQAAGMGLKPGRDLVNQSDQIAQLSIQGPRALKGMQKLTREPVENMPFYSFKVIEFAGISDVVFSATGYTGAGGCELYTHNEHAGKLWNAVLEAGQEFGIQPVGLGARDTLRLEMGYCLYGNDITEETSPMEAGLGWITKFSEGKDFIDRERLLKQKEEGVTRRLKGFEMIDRGIPRQHYPVMDTHGHVIGEVTSGTMSPMLKKGIGMAYLEKPFWEEGTIIEIVVRNRNLKARVVKVPFYTAG